MIRLSRSALLLSCLSLLLFLTAACGAGGPEGTYSTSAGNVVLELRSGGKANFTIMDPNVVKTVLDFDDNALYFSRAPIPWVRDSAHKIHARHLKHLGLYVFQRDALLEYPTLPQGELERLEQLEQLRWLENGWKIRVAEVEHDAVSVDVPEDVARVEKLLQGMTD